MRTMLPRALTIAGSDSSGGAGIQADLKTFTVMRVYGMTAITALTAQNTCGVAAIHPVPAAFVRAQLDAIMGDIGIDAAKTGMLATAEIIRTVAAAVGELRITPLVVDPVMVAQGGASLLEPAAREAMLRNLVPLATLLTPNVVWYAQVGALVVGHVLGLVVAHDRAVDVVRSRRLAARSQYPLLALMVVYTLGGMWLLSRG